MPKKEQLRPLTKVQMHRIHILIPLSLHNKVCESAENTDRSYSQMITSILRGVYGKETRS